MKVLYACTPYTQQKFENLARNTSTITYKEFVVVFSAMDSLLNYYELRTYSVHYTQHQKKVTPIFLRSCDYDNQVNFSVVIFYIDSTMYNLMLCNFYQA